MDLKDKIAAQSTSRTHEFRNLLARAPRAVASTAIIALTGCVFLAIFAPFVKIVAVHNAIGAGSRLLQQDRPKEALALFQRFQPWAGNYPILAPLLTRGIVRCNTRLNNMPEAKQGADFMYNSLAADRATAESFPGFGIHALMQEWPDRFANAFASLGSDNSAGLRPVSGYLAIFEELRRTSQYAEIKSIGRDVLVVRADDDGIKPLLDYVIWAEEMLELQEKDRIAAEAAPARRESRPGAQPAMATTAVVVLNVAQPAAGPDLNSDMTEVDRNYSEAITRYNEGVDKARALEKELEKSAGTNRTQLLDELRIMKGDLFVLRTRVQRAKTAFEAEND